MRLEAEEVALATDAAQMGHHTEFECRAGRCSDFALESQGVWAEQTGGRGAHRDGMLGFHHLPTQGRPPQSAPEGPHLGLFLLLGACFLPQQRCARGNWCQDASFVATELWMMSCI